jgi:hypothetical protein
MKVPFVRAGATFVVVVLVISACELETDNGEGWRGLEIAPEHRCSAYHRDDYPYPQSVEPQIAASLGGWWSPYDGTEFDNRSQSDIEHIVAVSEAHDSGACMWGSRRRSAFARDLDNLTLATPQLNRFEKRDHDAANWLPEHNRCWFAGRVLAVRLEYDLTIDEREAAALDRVFAGCTDAQIATPVRPDP